MSYYNKEENMLPIPYESQHIESNGIKLHVVTAGPKDGEPILLLHGFPEFWFGWRKQIPALVQAGFRVIVPDQRGYNLSDVPKDVRAYTLPELGLDMIGLLDHFGIDQVNLVGHDWGAAVAWGLAITFPQRVRRLAILNVPHPMVILRFWAQSPDQLLKSWYIGFFQIPSLADWAMRRNHFASAVQAFLSSSRPGTFTESDIVEYKKAWTNSGGLTGMINWYRALMQHRPLTPQDIRVHMPVLIQWGKRDAYLNYKMAEANLEFCDEGKLILYDDATHWLQHEEAQAVNEAIIAHFQQ
jgi:pimeloyl-ACP methyl ester carboxylesterase